MVKALKLLVLVGILAVVGLTVRDQQRGQQFDRGLDTYLQTLTDAGTAALSAPNDNDLLPMARDEWPKLRDELPQYTNGFRYILTMRLDDLLGGYAKLYETDPLQAQSARAVSYVIEQAVDIRTCLQKGVGTDPYGF